MLLYHAKLKHQKTKMMIQTLLKPLTVHLDNSHLDATRTLYKKLMLGDVCAEEACSYNALEKNKDNFKNNVKKSPRTLALWVHYMSMIDILCKFIRA